MCIRDSDETTLKADGSVRVYGTWKGNSIASGKSFSLDSYHYFSVKDGKILSESSKTPKTTKAVEKKEELKSK